MRPSVHKEVKCDLNKYEVVYIIRMGLEDEMRAELIEKFKGIIEADGGVIEKIDEWGKRRLAYPIDDEPEGYYVLMHFEAKPELPKELERNFKINDNIMRYMVIRRDA